MSDVGPTPAEQLEQRFLPLLEEARRSLAQRYPAYEFATDCGPEGSATALQGHAVGLEVTFPDAAPEEADCVALSVGVCHLTTEPKIECACVAWGHGWSPAFESCHLLEHPVAFSREALARIESELPPLLANLEAAVIAWRDWDRVAAPGGRPPW